MTPPPPELESRAPRESRWAWSVAALVLLIATFGFYYATEFQSAAMLEADGYYHIKIADLYRSGECAILGADFPWARFSAYNGMRHDWQLLYHLALIPFTGLPLMTGGKLSAVFFATCLVLAVYGVLRAEGARWPALFAGLLLVAAPVFMFRMHLPRPTPLFLTLFVLLIHFAAQERVVPSALLMALCLWTYNVPHSLLAMVGVVLVVHTLMDRRPPWKLAGALALGMLVGVIAHPGFWVWNGSSVELFSGLRVPQNAAQQLWRQIAGTLAVADAGSVVQIDGRAIPMRSPVEFAPLTGPQVWRETRILGTLLVLALAGLAVRRRRPPPATWISLALSCVYLALSLNSARFFEYWVPLTLIASALLFRDGWFTASSRPESRIPKWATAVALIVALGAGIAAARENIQVTLDALHRPQARSGPWYADAMAWIESHSRPGELIFHTGWDDFAPMLFYNSHNHYIVSFDPYFFYMRDPAAYRLWVEASRGRLSPRQTVDVIRSFGARYALVTHKDIWMPFLDRLLELPEVGVVFTDDHCTVLSVEAVPAWPVRPTRAP